MGSGRVRGRDPVQWLKKWLKERARSAEAHLWHDRRKLHTECRGEVMVRLAVVIALLLFASPAWATDDDIVGTYRLISANRVILATGETEDSYGKNPIGFMTYGRDGRMMGMIVFSNRPKAESLDKM